MKFFSAIAAIILFFAFGAMAETTNNLSDAEIQGRQLAQQILKQRPVTNSTQNGILEIRDKNGNRIDIPVKCEAIVSPTMWYYASLTNWICIYEAHLTNRLFEVLKVVHRDGFSNQYIHDEGSEPEDAHLQSQSGMLPVNENTPFANSDFWICDLGLEFLHWPEQKILPNPTNLKRGRTYTLLESINPNPSTNGYSRVLSYIDKETGGILEAEAYDSHDRLLKEFYPKDFKKVDGQWQLQSMEMDNVQTGSRSWIEFDVKKQ
jgi:Outer membrane lipoprotein-sorting protein